MVLQAAQSSKEQSRCLARGFESNVQESLLGFLKKKADAGNKFGDLFEKLFGPSTEYVQMNSESIVRKSSFSSPTCLQIPISKVRGVELDFS